MPAVEVAVLPGTSGLDVRSADLALRDPLLLSVLIIHPDGLDPIFPVDESQFSGCFPPLVAMMKATDSRQPNDLGRR